MVVPISLLQERKNMYMNIPAIGDEPKNTIRRFIPNIIVENHLEFAPNIIRI
jgi:hypothetical protein